MSLKNYTNESVLTAANGQAADIYDAAWIVGAATGAFCPEVSA